MKELDHPSYTARRMEAESLVSICIYEKSYYMELVKKDLKYVQDEIENYLIDLYGTDITKNVKYAEQALCGDRNHCSTTEAYYFKGTYNFHENLQGK